MQDSQTRRSNETRTDEMRARLLDAARALFTAEGLAGTSTPAIVDKAGVTRGALYHHFASKTAIFRAVVEREAAAVASAIEAADHPDQGPHDQLLSGAAAYLAAMAEPARTRLLLVEGPAVLGPATLREIEGRHGDASLRIGLEAAMGAGSLPRLPVAPLAAVLSAMFERAALDVSDGAVSEDYMQVTKAILAGLALVASTNVQEKDR